MNQTAIGIFAHVDAGKTTLCEAMLYTTGAIRKLGRVDHKDSWFDTFALERKRGITIFSKQATFAYKESVFTILDTPGHVDFVAEAERTIPILDFAVLLVSATDGIQPHTQTLWNLLERYHIPTVLFVTKTDVAFRTKQEIFEDLQSSLSSSCVFVKSSIEDEDTLEDIASQDFYLMQQYLDNGLLMPSEVRTSFYQRHFFPVVFGSGLKLDGITCLLDIFSYLERPALENRLFAAKVFKISHDIKGNRLTHVRILGGTVKNRDSLSYTDIDGKEISEKITGIRIYNSERFSNIEEANASQVVVLTGLSSTFAGQGLGEAESSTPFMEPVLRYELIPSGDIDSRALYNTLLELQEEEPQLRLSWDPVHETIFVHLMGNIQIEILKSLIWEKYKIEVDITNSQILYKETISNVVEGIGHFEPLRHYAEVHLVLEPGEPGSGLVFGSVLPTDRLGATWQNMILYHLQEKIHLGVLGGFPLTDVRITLVGGKISLKHTEGGDIREASLRAVRHGLMNAKNVLLEPFFHYSLIIPTNNVGRAANDIQQMSGNFSIETLDDGFSKLTGYAPVSEMQSYYSEVIAYTSGHGKLTCVSGGYRPCHNSSEVLSSLSYDPESDLANTPDSIFCKHGAGFLVKWNDVTHYMHIDSFIKPEKADNTHATPHRKIDLDEKALEELMMKEFGPIRRRQYGKAAIIRTAADDSEDDEPKQHYIIIDGYNLMFLLEEKGIISSGSLDLSRKEMLNLLSNYSGFSGNHILVVFDAYHNDTSTDKRMIEDGIDIIYTEYGETADAYIERTANTLGKNDHVRVISSDNLVRLGVFRSGIQRTSSAYFYEELVNSQSNLNKILEAHKIKEGQVLSDFINEDTLKQWQKKLN